MSEHNRPFVDPSSLFIPPFTLPLPDGFPFFVEAVLLLFCIYISKRIPPPQTRPLIGGLLEMLSCLFFFLGPVFLQVAQQMSHFPW